MRKVPIKIGSVDTTFGFAVRYGALYWHKEGTHLWRSSGKEEGKPRICRASKSIAVVVAAGASHAWERRGTFDFQVVDKKKRKKKERGRISREEEESGKEEQRRAL